MNNLVLLRMVPDVVEELEVAADGKSLDTSFLRNILNERDDHALEEALILKDHQGGRLTVLALDSPEIDDVLFTSLAKGADRAVKITDAPPGLTTRGTATLCAQVIASGSGLMPADLILTGVQALDDLDGLSAPLLAQHLGWPYLGVVTQVTPDPAGGRVTVLKEYAGGVRGEYAVQVPAVLGIQAAQKPPRYVPVAKVRAAMKTQKIETIPAPTEFGAAQIEVRQLAKPVVSSRAEMIEGTPEEVAGKLAELLAQRALI